MDGEQDIPFVYENGVLKPEGAVDLPEGTRGVARIHPSIAQHDFWRSRTVDELAREQGVPHRVAPSDLRGDWPADDSIDEFLAQVRKGRR
jgi:predicted DNA-binding antitoxin AbrB/MazE fold protein